MAKDMSESYEMRSRADRDSLRVAFETYGLGAGWGSVRASSFFPDLAGNAGVVGVLLVCWFALRVSREASQARRLSMNVDQAFVVDASSGALVGILAAASVSGAGIALLSFYLLLGLLVGTSARIKLEARATGITAFAAWARAPANRHSASRSGPGGLVFSPARWGGYV